MVRVYRGQMARPLLGCMAGGRTGWGVYGMIEWLWDMGRGNPLWKLCFWWYAWGRSWTVSVGL